MLAGSFPGTGVQGSACAKRCVHFSAGFWVVTLSPEGLLSLPARDAQGHMVREVWPAFRLPIMGSFESLVLPRCLWVLDIFVPKHNKIDFYY